MTPTERAKREGEFFAEFREKMRDCAVLQQQLEDTGAALAAIAKDIEDRHPVGDIAKRLPAADAVASTLEDYRTTLARCQSLHHALTRYGDAAGLAKVDFPNY